MLEGYTKYKEISLPETTDDETNITVRINLDYESSMQSQFQDIRFTETDDTQLDQQRITYTESTDAVWYFNVASKPAAGKTLRMQYGNPNAVLLSDNIAIWYWRGELDKNIEVECGSGCTIGDTEAYINAHDPGSYVRTVESLSTWHSIAIITLMLEDYIKNRWFGMGPYVVGETGGPFSNFTYFGNGSSSSLTVGHPLVTQVIGWSGVFPVGETVKLIFCRNTLSDCTVYINDALKAHHTGASCNDSNSCQVTVNQASNGYAGYGKIHVYGIEIFNLPQYVIDIDDWEIEPGPEVEVVLGNMSGDIMVEPVESLSDNDGSEHFIVSGEVAKILKGKISVSDVNMDLSGTLNGYENKQPYLKEATVNGGNSLTTSSVSVFIMIKNTGRTYSSSSELGDALNKALKITYADEFVSLLTTSEPYYMKDNNGKIRADTIVVETVELDGSTISSGSGLAVEFLALEAA
jgi:hypothetical protein